MRRREYSEGETDRRTAINFAYGGVYDELIDDEEFVKEHKRRRTGAKGSAKQSRQEETPIPSDEETKESGTPPPSPPADKGDTAAGDGGDSPAISNGSSDSDSD